VQRVLDAVVEERAVGQLGQRVVEGAVAQLGLGGLALGDVAARQDDALDVLVVAHVGDRALEVQAVAVLVAQAPLDRRAAALAGEQLGELAVVVLVDHAAQRAALQLAGLVAEDRPRRSG
jgi:hypothetical protein